MPLYGILLSIRTYLHIGLLLFVVLAVASNRLQPTTHHYSFLPHAQQKQDRSPAVHILLERLPHTTNSRPLKHRQYCVQTSLFRLIHRFIASMRITIEWSPYC